MEEEGPWSLRGKEGEGIWLNAHMDMTKKATYCTGWLFDITLMRRIYPGWRLSELDICSVQRFSLQHYCTTLIVHTEIGT